MAGGLQNITGTIARAWNSHDGVLFALVNTGRGQVSCPLQVRGVMPEDLIGQHVRCIDGLWVLTKRAAA